MAARIVAFDTTFRSEFQSNRGIAARLANRPPEGKEFAPCETIDRFLFEKSG